MIDHLERFELQDLKTKPLNSDELDELYEKTKSYEALFNKRSRLYKERQLKDANLQEDDFRTLILEHYTFLKRPVALLKSEIFVGNSKSNVEAFIAKANEK